MKKFFQTMKAKTKKFFAVCALALILAVAAGYGVQTSMNNNVQLSDLALANVEALAFWEAPKDGGPNFSYIYCFECNGSYGVIMTNSQNQLFEYFGSICPAGGIFSSNCPPGWVPDWP